MVRTLHTRYAVLYIGENENKRDRIGFIRKTRSIKQYVKITADQIVLFHPEN